MKKTNHLSYNKRLKTGNEVTEFARLYKYKCFPEARKFLADLYDTDEDIKQGIDYGMPGVCDFQSKKRESGDDFGYESQRWHKKKNGDELVTFYTLPGRDARTQAIYTSTISKDEKEIQICRTEKIHSLAKLVLEERNNTKNKKYDSWEIKEVEDENNNTICSVLDLSDKQIIELWLNTLGTPNSSSHLFTSKEFIGSDGKAIQVKSKIDDGGNFFNVDFLKIIIYIPYSLLNVKTLKLRDGEILRKPDTWKGKRLDTIDDYL